MKFILGKYLLLAIKYVWGSVANFVKWNFSSKQNGMVTLLGGFTVKGEWYWYCSMTWIKNTTIHCDTQYCGIISTPFYYLDTYTLTFAAGLVFTA